MTSCIVSHRCCPGSFAANRAESRLDDEMRSFVEMSAADKIRDGVPAAEARRLALIELGGVEQVKEGFAPVVTARSWTMSAATFAMRSGCSPGSPRSRS